MNICTILNSNIKGYHIFKLRPHPHIEMLVKEERMNPYDPDAMLVMMPVLDDINPDLYDEVTRERKGEDPDQTVRTNFGKVIGRVPANIGKICTKLLKDGDVKNVCHVHHLIYACKMHDEEQLHIQDGGKIYKTGAVFLRDTYF